MVDETEINIGRPDLFNDTDFEHWQKIIDFIDSHPGIRVNGAYGFIKEYLAEKQGYGGGGMKFCFWCNENDLREFTAFLDANKHSYITKSD